MLSLENGTIYISATETALHCYLFQAMEAFNREYPNVHFKILNNSTKESIKVLKEGNVDFAVVSAPFQVKKPLKMEILREYHDILIGGEKYKDLKGKKVSLQKLTKYPWVSLTSEAITRAFLNQYFERHNLKFEPDVELATTDMILPAVRYNLGIGFIPPEFAKDDLESGEIFEIQVQEAFPERNIILMYAIPNHEFLQDLDHILQYILYEQPVYHSSSELRKIHDCQVVEDEELHLLQD